MEEGSSSNDDHSRGHSPNSDDVGRRSSNNDDLRGISSNNDDVSGSLSNNDHSRGNSPNNVDLRILPDNTWNGTKTGKYRVINEASTEKDSIQPLAKSDIIPQMIENTEKNVGTTAQKPAQFDSHETKTSSSMETDGVIHRPKDVINEGPEKPRICEQRDVVRERTISVISQDTVGSVVVIPVNISGTSDHNVLGVEEAPKAPDGGFGWVLVAAVFLMCFNLGLHLVGFSVFYVALVEHFQSDHGATGWVGSIFSFSGNVFGVVVGAIVERFGCRRVAVVGCIITGIGMGLSSLLISIPYLYFTYGILGGVGVTMVYLPAGVLLQRYVDKKRALALGIATSSVSFGALTAAPLFNFLIEKYGIQGSYLIATGIWLQNLVSIGLFRPVPSKYQRKPQTHAIPNENILKETGKPAVMKHGSDSKKKNIFADMVDFTPLKNVKLVLFLVGTLFMNFGPMGFMTHFLSRSVSLGVERRLGVLLQVIYLSGSALARVVFSFVGNAKGVDRVLMYAALITLSGFAVVLFPIARTPATISVVGVLQGLLQGSYFTIQPTVMVDVSSVVEIAKISGLLNMTIGIATLLTTPLAGFIYDVTDNYDVPYYVIGSIQLCGAVVLLVLAVLNRTRWKKSPV